MTQLWPPQRLWAVTKAANDGHRGNGIGAPRIVKISMRHSCNTSVVRQCARDNALDSAVSAAQPSPPGTGECCPLLDGSSPRECSMNSVTARRNEPSPNKISFDRHSCFTDRTHLPA